MEGSDVDLDLEELGLIGCSLGQLGSKSLQSLRMEDALLADFSMSDIDEDTSNAINSYFPSLSDHDMHLWADGADHFVEEVEEVLEEEEVQEPEEEGAPFPVTTVTIKTEEEDDLRQSLWTSAQRTIELHNYSSLSPTALSSNTESNKSCSPSSSVSSSPNARKSSNIRGTGRSKPITDLTLTDEERRLLNKEGYHEFPEGSVPLTKLEEKILRKIRRKIRNKRSAQCSRQRKKEYVEDLEKRYDKCTNENERLKKEMMKLRKENESLLVKMKKLLMGSNSPNGQASFKTSFFVLILSFLLILVPCFRPDIGDDGVTGLTMDMEMMTTGRHLLMSMSSSDADAGYYYYYSGSAINESTESLVNNISSPISY